MSEAENTAIVSELYRKWHETRGGSVDAWIAAMSDDLVFRSLGEVRKGMEFAGARQGKETMHAYFEALTAGWAMEHYTVDEFIAQGDRVIMIGSTAWTNKATGKRAETAKVDVMRLRGGQIVEFAEYYDTAAVAAAGLPDG